MTKKPYLFKPIKPEEEKKTGPKPDFKAFLGEYQNMYQSGRATKPLYKKPAFMLTTMFLATIVLVLLLLPEQKGDENKTPKATNRAENEPPKTTLQAEPTPLKVGEKTLPDSEKQAIKSNQTRERQEEISPKEQALRRTEPNQLSRPMAFEGDPDGWEGYVARNIRQPNESIQGTVTLNFVIDTTGKVKQISIPSGKGMGYTYDGEAIRLLHLSSGKWRPALEKGVKVEKAAEVKVAFQLKYDTSY